MVPGAQVTLRLGFRIWLHSDLSKAKVLEVILGRFHQAAMSLARGVTTENASRSHFLISTFGLRT
jgi:hypothetical protein